MRKYVFGGLAMALACAPLVATVPAAAAPAAHAKASPAALNPDQDGVNPANSTLTGISCVGTSFCMAVGWTFEGEDESVQISTWSTLAEIWNGSSWSVIPTPATTGGSAQLFSVACSTPTSCEAVGYDSGVQLAIGELWDGHQWHLQATPDPDGVNTATSLNGIACTSATSCLGVGYLVTFSPVFSDLPLVEQWNGMVWTIQPSAPTGSGSFAAVACSSQDACTAVGERDGDFAERWNGVSWVVQTMPGLGNVVPSLAAVSCPTASFCMAVGNNFTNTNQQDTWVAKSLTWNGATWSVSTPLQPAGATDTTFNAVSCTSPTACTALGGSDKTGPLVETWNGARWARQSTPDRPTPPVTGKEVTAVNAVACPTQTTCIGVGFLNQNSLTTNVLGISRNSHGWHRQTMAEPNNAATWLTGVACPTSKECVAVGRFDTPTFAAPIAETRRFGTWSIQAVPWPANTGGAWLTAIACPAADLCIAVGNYSFGGGAEVDPNVLPFADEWNGTTWTMLPAVSIPPNQLDAFLNGIACISVTSCVAVGYTDNGAGDSVLIEAWNGATWSAQPATVSTDALDPRLASVSCASGTLCFASGYEGHTQGPQTALVEGWNGSTWSVQPAPSSYQGDLTGVSCASTVFCMATGDILNAGPGIGPSALEWNGASWSLVATPGPAGNANTLGAVSCFSSSMCMAVGGSATNRAEVWNGVAWSMLTAPPVPSALSTELLAVVCPQLSVCTAVGMANQPDIVSFLSWRTVAELWEQQQWRIQTTPNAT
jgi:hypothetical protein